MKIAVCSKGQNMTDEISVSLWQTPYIIFFDTETRKTRVMQNLCRHHGIHGFKISAEKQEKKIAALPEEFANAVKCCCAERTVKHVIISGAKVLIGIHAKPSDVRRLKHHGKTFIETQAGLSVEQALDKYQRTALHILD